MCWLQNIFGGGIHFDAALAALRPTGRIAVCGNISKYGENSSKSSIGSSPENIYLGQMIGGSTRIEGFSANSWIRGAKRAPWLKDQFSRPTTDRRLVVVGRGLAFRG